MLFFAPDSTEGQLAAGKSAAVPARWGVLVTMCRRGTRGSVRVSDATTKPKGAWLCCDLNGALNFTLNGEQRYIHGNDVAVPSKKTGLSLYGPNGLIGPIKMKVIPE
jgi:hypothetical protein